MNSFMSRKGRLLPGLLACAMLSLMACGGGSDSSPAPAPAPAPVNAKPTAVLALAADTGAPSLGAEVAVSGAGSTDPEAAALTYTWALQSKPADSALTLSAVNAPALKFTPDRMGAYVVRLRVADPAGAFAEQDLTVTVANHAPVAVVDKSALTLLSGNAVTASAALSYDQDGDALTYAWSVESKPADAPAGIAQSNGSELVFTPERPGSYILLLKVSDGKRPVVTRLDVKVLAQSAGTVALPFTPLEARYSKSLDQAIMVSSAPNALKIVDPFSGLIKTVLLPAPAKALTLSADGKLGAVLHEGVVSLVDLASATLVQSSSSGGAQTEVFLTNGGVVFLIGQTGGQWVTPAVTTINARTGVQMPAPANGAGHGYFYGVMRGVFSAINNKAFAVSSGLSPTDLTYFTVDPLTSALLSVGDSPYHGDYAIDSPLFLSNKEDLVFTSSGTFFRTDTLAYAGRLGSTGSLISLSQSSAQETLAIAGINGQYPDYGMTYPTFYKRYTGALMSFGGDLSLPMIGGLPSYGRSVFHSAAGSHVLLVQTGSAASTATGLKFYLMYR